MDHQDIVTHQKKRMNEDWSKSTTFRPTNELEAFLGDIALDVGYGLVGEDLKGKSVLIVCAGNGYESNYFQKKGAIVTATDISEEALKKIAEFNPAIHIELQNAEALSYEDGSFDYVIVRAGLHHLPRPLIGVYEMLRVSKKGILIMEAQDSIVMRFLRRTGLVLEIEPSGNYVYTFTRREIEKVCSSLFLERPRIRTFFYQYIPFLNNKIYPRLTGRFWFNVCKAVLSVFNAVFGRFGNNLVCYIKKT